MDIAIIGGGAAGFFSAINIKLLSPQHNITIYESSTTVLSKVRISGGGRCNLTNSFEGIKNLSKVYPRGYNLIKRAFKKFNNVDTYNWFETNGVKLITQSDRCVFPVSQNSGEIIDTFLRLAKELEIKIKPSHKILSIEKIDTKFWLTTNNINTPNIDSDIVIIATGGTPNISGFNFLEKFKLNIEKPTPSLFSLNIKDSSIVELTGTVIENAIVGIQNSKLRANGELLITHWGVSGPAILKLSSYGAKVLNNTNYKATLIINWLGINNEILILDEIKKIIQNNHKKLITTARPFNLTARVWCHILSQANISTERRWGEIGSKGINKMISVLTGDLYEIAGKSTHKEEFVTCGGVALNNINHNTMETHDHKNLYFAGEVLDIDAITGGFNLQAAWSTAYAIANAISKQPNS